MVVPYGRPDLIGRVSFLIYKRKKTKMDYLDKYDNLLSLLTEELEINGKKYTLKEEFEKFFVNGNKKAGTRIRKFMQEIKNASQDIRTDVQDYKKKL
jgi:hypothetical protein